LEQELTEMGILGLQQGFRGVSVKEASLENILQINYCSRLATRVLLPLLQFRCYDRASLYEQIADIPWKQYLPAGKTFAIDANVTHPHFRNSLFAAQCAKDAICDRLRKETGVRPHVCVNKPDVQLNLYVHNTQAAMSLDTSGTPLHKRGYRETSMEAPMNETLAAGLLKLANFRGDEVLYDPCCGSGTLLIEAALLASQTPSGFLRKQWGFMHIPGFSQEVWLKVKRKADEQKKPLEKGRIYGSDINRNSIVAATSNLRASGLTPFIQIAHTDFRYYTNPIAPHFVITNPPHGKRLEQLEPLRALYRSLGLWMKTHAAKPGRGFVFTGNLELAKEVGLAPKRRHIVSNSGVDSRFLEYEIY
jgi:putative N6-adenine-specific DNA methylase